MGAVLGGRATDPLQAIVAAGRAGIFCRGAYDVFECLDGGSVGIGPKRSSGVAQPGDGAAVHVSCNGELINYLTTKNIHLWATTSVVAPYCGGAPYWPEVFLLPAA